MKHHPNVGSISGFKPPTFSAYVNAVRFQEIKDSGMSLVPFQLLENPKHVSRHFKNVPGSRKRALEDLAYAQGGILRLAGKAQNGQADAFGYLLNLANYAIMQIDLLAEERPELVKAYAFDCPGWPVRLPCTKPQAELVFERIVDRLEVGLHLSAQFLSLNQGRVDMFAYLLPCYMRMLRTPGVDVSHLPDAEECRKLPRLSKESLNEWWRVALAIFNRSYPDLDMLDIPEVRSIRDYRPSKCEARSKFIERIKRRFWDLAFTAASAGDVASVASQNATAAPLRSKSTQNTPKIAPEDYLKDLRSDDFDEADLRDPNLLITRLRDCKDEISKFIRSHLPEKVRLRVMTLNVSGTEVRHEDAVQLIPELLSGLNRLIRDVLLFKEKCFRSVCLEPRLKKQLENRAKGNKHLRHLNRQILEAALPDVFVPRMEQQKNLKHG